MTPRPAEFVLHIRADRADRYGRTPSQRLRVVLKRLLRSHGLRCVSVREVGKCSASLASGDTLVNSESR